MQNKLNEIDGITLIALVITIVILLILSGVSIAMLTGENGILNQARKAKNDTEQASKNEMAALESIENYLNEYTGTENGYSKDKGVNVPKVATGMKEVMFRLPEGNNKGEVIEKGQADFDENNWYNYEESKWANTRTQDGSYWVWIPRYAYKITYNDVNDKSKGGSIDVKFLVGTTDQYYDEQGNLKTAKRATSAAEIVDTTKDYYVHPAFTDESKINFANGGWDKEQTGIWVAKFEAGFASGNNSAPVKASSENYTQKVAVVSLQEAGTSEDSMQSARNWLDGIYGEKTTSIKYPTFQPLTYVMNYTSASDQYNICRALTEEGNIYKLNNVDSHLIKKSEWGAVAYLGYSQYGTKGNKLYVNNINLNSGNRIRTESAGKSGVDSVYAVTGVTTGTTNDEVKNTTIDVIKGTTGNASNEGVYTWDQIEGQKASSTLNMYGVYDMSGGTWERTSAYLPNENSNLKAYGLSMTYDGDKLKTISTKYTTVYPFDSSMDNTSLEWTNQNLNDARQANYLQNKYIFGDGIREVSTQGGGHNSWNNNYSVFVGLSTPFALGSGHCWNGEYAGLFYFHSDSGSENYGGGFRATLVQ